MNGNSKLNTGVWGRGIAKSLAGALSEAQSAPGIDNNTPILGEAGSAPSFVEVEGQGGPTAESCNEPNKSDGAIRQIAESLPEDSGITFGDLGKH